LTDQQTAKDNKELSGDFNTLKRPITFIEFGDKQIPILTRILVNRHRAHKLILSPLNPGKISLRDAEAQTLSVISGANTTKVGALQHYGITCLPEYDSYDD
jgi:hypothetical protein